jgi:hypothetical protein
MEAAFSATVVVGRFVDMALARTQARPNCADAIWVSVFEFDGDRLRRTRFRHALDALERGHAGDAGDRTEVDGLSYTERRTRPKADQHRRARYRDKHGEFGMSASAMRSALIGEHWRYE